jgi:transcriptional regulator with XRE-family HTH domain
VQASRQKDDDPEWAQFTRAIGRNLLLRRLALGLTQQEAAELMGIQPESVSRIENGTIVPTLFRLRQFSRVYDCSLASLLEGASGQSGDLAVKIAAELEVLGEVDRRFIGSLLTSVSRHLRRDPKPPAEPNGTAQRRPRMAYAPGHQGIGKKTR